MSFYCRNIPIIISGIPEIVKRDNVSGIRKLLIHFLTKFLNLNEEVKDLHIRFRERPNTT